MIRETHLDRETVRRQGHFIGRVMYGSVFVLGDRHWLIDDDENEPVKLAMPHEVNDAEQHSERWGLT